MIKKQYLIMLNKKVFKRKKLKQISKKLTMAERFGLFQFLPPEGDLVTYKEIRKLKETLNPTSKEDEEYSFEYGFRCPHVELQSNGKGFQCEFTTMATITPDCPIHKERCMSTGMLGWKPEMALVEKEIFFSKLSLKIITEALKKASKEKKVNDTNYSLFVKFGVEDE